MQLSWRKKLNEVVEALLPYEPEKIILYGSAARDQLTEDSDIDLLIIKKSDKSFLERIRDVLDLLPPIGIPVEPIVLTPEEFDKMVAEERLYAEMILKEGKILYEKR
jgi:predicted nucleotidyltransferase